MPRGRRGTAIWWAAAAALVAGIVIGFVSGYTAGQGNTQPAPAIGILGTGEPDPAEEPVATSDRPFSDGEIGSDRSDRSERSDRSDGSDRSDRSGSDGSDRAGRPGPAVPSNRPAVPDAAPRPDTRTAGGSNRNVPNQNVPNDPNDSNVNAPNDSNGSIEVLSRPAGAEVILDGRVVGQTPLSIPNVPPGAHSIRLELPGFNQWATSIGIKPGARTRVAASLEQP